MCVVGVKRSASPARSPAKRQCGGGQATTQPGCSHWVDGAPSSPPPSPTPSPTPSPSPLPPPHQRCCNWCGNPTTGPRPYCDRCATAGRECRACHRPMPDRFYTGDNTTCIACTRKRGHTTTIKRFGDVLATCQIDTDGAPDLEVCLRDNRRAVASAITGEPATKRGIRVYVTTTLRMSRVDVDGTVHTSEPVLRSDVITVLVADDIEAAVDAAITCLTRRLDAYMAEGSGWTLDAVLDITIHMAAYQPLYGASYLSTPPKLAVRKSIVNVRNDDNKCFMWAVLAGLHPATRHTERLSKYAGFEAEFDMAGIAFPVATGDIGRFEAQNGVSVNVFGYEDAVVYPLRLTELRDRPHVNLLLLADGEKRHYVLVKNLSRLVARRSGHDGVSFPCVYCLHVFCRADLLADHIPHCKPHGPQRVKMPSGDDTTLLFTHEDRQLRAPFIIYADFECYTEKLATCIPNTASFAHRYQQHTPSDYCFHVVSDHPGYTSTPVVYRGPDVVDHFIESLRHEHRLINAAIDCPVPMMMTPADIEDFAAAATCHICGKDATRMVRDHDHLTGAYRGAAHNKCNYGCISRGRRRRAGPAWRSPSPCTTCGDTTPTSSPQHSVATPNAST